jgi:hypothetical protein
LIMVLHCLLSHQQAMPASLGQGSCCSVEVIFGHGRFFIALLAPCVCVGLSDGHSDQQLMIICSLSKYLDISTFVNETKHISSFSLFTVRFRSVAKSAVSALWSQTYSITNTTYSKMLPMVTSCHFHRCGHCILSVYLFLPAAL